MTRKAIPLKTKLASALLQMLRPDDSGNFVRVISFEEAKRLTADQIISRFDFHHYPIPHAHDGPDEPWNLEPMLRDDHRKVTAERDVPMIAKTKRIQAREAGEVRPGPRIKTAGFSKAKPQRRASTPLNRWMP